MTAAVVPGFIQDARERFANDPFTVQVDGGDALLPESAQETRRRARAFVDAHVAPIATQIDRDDQIPEDLRGALAKEGFFGLSIPEDYGGKGSVLETCIAVEECSRVSASVGLMVAVQLLGSTPLVLGGDDRQKQEWLPKFATGERFCSYCLTEPGAGTDAASVQTRATEGPDGWLLNGTKQYITGAGRSDLYTVFARSGEGRTEMTALLVTAGTNGFQVIGTHPFSGIRGLPVGQLEFDDVHVPDEQLLGQPGKGFRLALATLDRARPAIAAQALGLAQGALDASMSYLANRVQFGNPLLDLPVVQYRLARHAAAISAARQITYHAAQLADAQRPELNAAASMAKLFTTDVAMEMATDAMQFWGGAGYMVGSPVERMFRDAKIMQVYEGTNEIQGLVIARALTRAWQAHQTE
jgi:alkylation response protein AidB-like acyl-CoA dehydrogenase